MDDHARIFTAGELATRYRISAHMIRRVVDRLGLADRLGRTRAIAEGKLEFLELGIRAAGYDRPEAARGRGRVAPNKGRRKRRPEAPTT